MGTFEHDAGKKRTKDYFIERKNEGGGNQRD